LIKLIGLLNDWLTRQPMKYDAKKRNGSSILTFENLNLDK